MPQTLTSFLLRMSRSVDALRRVILLLVLAALAEKISGLLAKYPGVRSVEILVNAVNAQARGVHGRAIGQRVGVFIADPRVLDAHRALAVPIIRKFLSA